LSGGSRLGFAFAPIVRVPQIILILLPFFLGAWKSRKLSALGTRHTTILAAAVAIMVMLATWTSGWRQAGQMAWSEGVWQPGVDWQIRLLPFAVVSWPAFYLLAVAISRRWRSGAVCSLFVIAVVIGSTATARGQSSPEDYTQWRGRGRDGSASSFTEPKSWPETLIRKWKVDVGEGYATPLVVGNAVYSFTRRDGDEVMAALDAITGRELWHTSYAAPYTSSRPAAAHGAGPKATPVFYDGKLFTLGISGVVAAFDASDGKLLWRTDAPSEPPFFSAAASPVAEQGVVMTHPGNYGPLTAFDANTGEVRWTAGEGGFFASPITADLAGTRQVIAVTLKNVIGVSVADGEVLWQYPWSGGAGGTMPVLYGETVIVSGLNLGVAAFKPTRHDGEWIAESVWETKDVSMYLCNPVVIDDTLFGLSHRDRGQFFALDARTGEALWLGQPHEATNSAVVKANDLLFFLNDDAELIVARSSRTGFETLRRYTIADSATWAQPAISGNRIFVKDVSALTLWTLN
jgi:outer membrane protein assembly factor BamB